MRARMARIYFITASSHRDLPSTPLLPLSPISTHFFTPNSLSAPYRSLLLITHEFSVYTACLPDAMMGLGTQDFDILSLNPLGLFYLIITLLGYYILGAPPYVVIYTLGYYILGAPPMWLYIPYHSSSIIQSTRSMSKNNTGPHVTDNSRIIFHGYVVVLCKPHG